MKLSEQIIKIRKDNNLTQEDFAKSLFVTRQAVSKWERDISMPDIDILKMISVKYNVSLNALLGINEEKKSEEKRVLAVKYNELYTYIALALAFIWFILLFFKNIILSFIFFILVLWIITIIVRQSSRPKVIMEYNDYGIYINHPNKRFIKYEDIIVIKRLGGNWYWNYSFGGIVIKTKNEVIKVNRLKKVDNVITKLTYVKAINNN